MKRLIMSDRKVQKGYITQSFHMPDIPEKLYFTIGEVAKLCDLKAHVLRYWESEFDELAPSKRRGNRRCYTREDIYVIVSIKHLLYSDGFTIEGARSQLKKRLIAQEGIFQQPEAVSLHKAEPPAMQYPKDQPKLATAVASLERALDLFAEVDTA